MGSDQHVRHRRVARRAGLVWRRTASQVLVLEPGTGRLVVLEGTGIELWDLLSRPRDVVEVVSTLASRHVAEPAIVAADVDNALDDLRARGLLDTVLH